MTTVSAILIALLICGIAAALEGVFAGKNVKGVLGKFRAPKFSPPFWLWVIIGILYYLICFVVLFRILRYDDNFAIRYTAFGLILVVMTLNAVWNYFFFRRRNLRGSFRLAIVYTFAAIALFICLWQFDLIAAYALIPYFLYLVYAFYWGLGLLRLNSK